MERKDIIQKIINKYNYESYLEIGVRVLDDTFNHICCPTKVGVDPAVEANRYTYPAIGHKCTSDDYFKGLDENIKFDIIFIDGCHSQAQVDKDIINSLKHLSVNGTIVMHDCNPPDLEHEKEHLCGTCWRSYYRFKTNHNVEAYVIDTDYGCGVIRRGNITTPTVKLKDDVIDYNFLNTNRKEVLNLISVEEFLQRLI